MNPIPATEQPTWLTERQFIPLPSDPAQLTIDQVRTVFAGDWSALKDVMKVAKEVDAKKPVSPTV